MDELKAAVNILKQELGQAKKVAVAARKAAEVRAKALESKAAERLAAMEDMAAKRLQDLSHFLLEHDLSQLSKLADIGSQRLGKAKRGRKKPK